MGIFGRKFFMVYTMNIAGLERDLPLCPVTEDLYIAAFICFGENGVNADFLFDGFNYLPPPREALLLRKAP